MKTNIPSSSLKEMLTLPHNTQTKPCYMGKARINAMTALTGQQSKFPNNLVEINP